MRYFVELAYNGKAYFGWQRQPNAISVQQSIEEALSTILRSEITITGCGRTDTGVHAKQYFIHFDFEEKFPKGFLSRINKFLPQDIVFYNLFAVKPEAHARFDAYERSYEYHLSFQKTPFYPDTSYHFPFAEQLNFEKMQEANQLLLEYEEFFPFCKTNTDVKTMKCELSRAQWERPNEQSAVFHITANRFLRGMVRLIVGMNLNVGLGKTTLEELKTAMDNQSRLKKSLSVPPQGLFLTGIKYPYV
jgi:tRNA pseudouridine38-40 synthase